jgi:hypothetical protein
MRVGNRGGMLSRSNTPGCPSWLFLLPSAVGAGVGAPGEMRLLEEGG